MKVANINVEYLDHMGSDLSVVNAARVSFDKQSDWIYKEVTEVDIDSRSYETYKLPDKLKESDEKLIQYLARHNHWTPFAHTALSLRVKAPIFAARQLVKHQVGLVLNEVSRRYVDTEPEFYIPSKWHKRPDASIKQGSGEEFELTSFDPGEAVTLNAEYSLEVYNTLLEVGIAPEEARMVLPLNTMTEWIWTGNVASWSRVCNLRMDGNAQKMGTQEIGRRIYDILLKYFPVSAGALVRFN